MSAALDLWNWKSQPLCSGSPFSQRRSSNLDFVNGLSLLIGFVSLVEANVPAEMGYIALHK